MKTKSRHFSVYLLKESYNSENSLKQDSDLKKAEAPSSTPTGSSLFILDSERREPWWKSYFGVKEELWQSLKGAILFVPANTRTFALTFGHVQHHLNDLSYEHDFGLLVSLNMIDPKAIRSADMLSPGDALRKRTQRATLTQLNYLDFDGNTEIIKSLTGQVKSEYKELFKNATGSSSLKVSLKIQPTEIAERCKTFLELYSSEDYKDSFPNIQNIVTVKDPLEKAPLDAEIVDRLNKRDDTVQLSIPEIVDYENETFFIFSSPEEDSDSYSDLNIHDFYEHISENTDNLTIDDLKKTRIILVDAEGNTRKSFSIYRCLISDANSENNTILYHMCEGEWYRVQSSFADELKSYIDQRCEISELPPYNHDQTTKEGKVCYSEEHYNRYIPTWNNEYISLDRKDISPKGSTEVEPCDIYRSIVNQHTNSGRRGDMFHIKISTDSSQLSHLFNQGVGAVELLIKEQEAKDKLKELIKARVPATEIDNYFTPINSRDIKIIYGIITKKPAEDKSKNLPLFSKMSLMRSMQWLTMLNIESSLIFIADNSPNKNPASRYPMYEIEIKKKKAFPVPNQGLDHNIEIKRCSRSVTNNPDGTRFRIKIKETEGKTGKEFSTSHKWPATKI
ncbi:TIGR04141 family sporadically distributed protein [Metapseudomonas otitidis]|uniref:TIGR04141 family sporadically distributed protein n=1 Tax=Metapseudomonas otitidis TaxID=319939 RepID=UPI00262BFA81|nr:TIGR04141 family sporadically distributed protein [Pseudomonas otitidis]